MSNRRKKQELKARAHKMDVVLICMDGYYVRLFLLFMCIMLVARSLVALDPQRCNDGNMLLRLYFAFQFGFFFAFSLFFHFLFCSIFVLHIVETLNPFELVISNYECLFHFNSYPWHCSPFQEL